MLIAAAVDLRPDHSYQSADETLRLFGLAEFTRLADTPQNMWSHWTPRYTTSTDAAMSLVPTMRVMLSEWDDEKHLRPKGPWQAILSELGSDASFDAMKGYRCDHAATPAIALTAACLRAHAAIAKENEGG